MIRSTDILGGCQIGSKMFFSGPIRVGLYNPDAILGFEGFLVVEILKAEHQIRSSGRSEFLRPQFSTFFNFVFRIYSLRA